MLTRTSETATERPASLAPFRYPVFRAIWFASLGSNFGSLIQAVGAAWMMAVISDSVGMVALVQASTSAPVMIFSLASGAIADSFSRRHVMLAAQFLMLSGAVALTVFTLLGLITPWLLLGFTFLIGCGMALFNPSWQASVGDMVPRADLPAAVVLNGMGFNLTRSVGPAIGGAIVAAAGAAAAFAINALSYIGLIVVLLRWKTEAPPTTLPREPFHSAMAAGLRYVAMSPNITKVLLRAFVFGFTTIIILAILPIVARDLLHGGPVRYGVLLGAFGVGAVGGALLNGQLRQRLTNENMARLGFVGFAICAAVTAISSMTAITVIALMLGGACWVVALSLFNVTVQLSAPRWVVGRALALYQTATFAGLAIGSWIWGIAAELYGAEAALLAAAILMLAGAALGLLLPLPARTALNLDPLNRFTVPTLALDIQPHSGPIVITIEYIIKDADIAAFLEAMTDRRRIRLRDGARNWTLMRDLQRPELWVESYNVPTWVEYVRHNQRPTFADEDIGARLRALHSGPEAPRVQRLIERQTTRPEPLPIVKEMIELP